MSKTRSSGQLGQEILENHARRLQIQVDPNDGPIEKLSRLSAAFEGVDELKRSGLEYLLEWPEPERTLGLRILAAWAEWALSKGPQIPPEQLRAYYDQQP